MASATELETSEKLIASAQRHLAEVELFARSRGLEDYLERGRISFERQVAEELNVVCDPDAQGASERAHQAIESLRVHVAQLSTSR